MVRKTETKPITSRKMKALRRDDAEDLAALRRARAADKGGPGLSVQEVRRKLGLVKG